MAETPQLIQALKRHLKAQGITYRTVAKHLKLSEASVKRILSTTHLSLHRLESIADLAGISLSELVLQAQQAEAQIQTLTLEQEQHIASDMLLLMIAINVISGFSYEQLRSHYQIDEHTLIQKLALLDKLALLELHPNNRIRLRIAPNFHWRTNGPIQQFFLKRVAADFLASDFNQDTEKLLVFNGLCSATTNQKIQQRMQSCMNEVAQLTEEDKHHPLTGKHGTTLVLALRQWQFTEFKALTNNQSNQKNEGNKNPKNNTQSNTKGKKPN